MNQILYDEIKNTLDSKPKKDVYVNLLNKILEEEKGIYEDNVGKCKMISLDTSSTVSGWAYYEAGELITSAEIDFSKEKDTDIRIENMVMGIFNVLNTYMPDIVVIEKNVVGRNAHTERMLGHIVGCVKGWTLANYKEFAMLTPGTWRKEVKGNICCPRKREEAKRWSIQRVKELYSLDVKDNEADAILVGCALIIMRDK